MVRSGREIRGQHLHTHSNASQMAEVTISNVEYVMFQSELLYCGALHLRVRSVIWHLRVDSTR